MFSICYHRLDRCWSRTRSFLFLSLMLSLAACGGGGSNDSASSNPGMSMAQAGARAAMPPGPYINLWVNGKGLVTSNPVGMNCPWSSIECSETFTGATSVVLTAKPSPGYAVSAWGGPCAGSTATTCSFALGSIHNVSVTFAVASGGGSATAPSVLFTDIASGPTSGGENNNGVYLSIFGRNFGATLTNLSVTIGGHPVAKIISLGASRVGAANPGLMPMQQIVVQVGSLAGAALGTSLPIVVGATQSSGVVGYSPATAAATFMPTPGRVLFVALTGNVNGGTAGDITKPYRYVQRSDYSDVTGALAVSKPGDVIVMRAGTWQDLGFESYFVRFIRPDASACGGGRGSGLAPSSTGGPITLMGYPGEDVFIDIPPTVGGKSTSGALAGLNAQTYPCAGQYINISNLRVEGGGADGAINLEIAATGWRIVNNEITAKTATSGALAGGIAGDGPNDSFYGNYIHDIYCGAPGSAPPWPGPKQNHGIYVDGGGVNANFQGGSVQGTYDIAYNYIHNALGGYGLNVYNDANSAATIANVHFHDNLIDSTGKGGINIADGSGAGIEVYNNIVVNSGYSGLRFNTNTLSGAKIYNNAFYVVNVNKDAAVGVIENDWNVPNGGWDIENNIFYSVASPYGNYMSGDVSATRSMGTFTKNLYFNGEGSNSLDTAPLTADPQFLHSGTVSGSTGLVSGYDLHPQPTSPVIHAGSSTVASIVTVDFDDMSGGSAPSYDVGPYTFTP